ncbi:MAG: ribosome maturation factor RimP [Gammaproteobacteria bacterium]|jgi:ribosome maturation factor RimP
MRQAPANIQALIEPAVETLGYELVGIEYLSQGKHSLLRVYIDRQDGITVDDCERVSHQVSGLLDVEDVIHGHYNLEVSSPGLDRPLFTIEQFRRFRNQKAKVKLSTPVEGRRKFTGVIHEVNDDNVVLEVEGEDIELAFSAIEKANLVPDF